MESKPSPKSRLRPLSRFVLRSPTLPFDVLARWASLSSVAERRQALADVVGDPMVREALYLASPDLDAQIAAWQREPETPGGVAVERALVRYISRMASRSTPFGLFASVAVGRVADATSFTIPPRDAATRHTRLDNDLLFQLCADLVRDRGVRRFLQFRPNESLYFASGRYRYAEARMAGATRAYHLVAVDRTPYLDAIIERARTGATLEQLVQTLCADPEISADEALAFVHELIDVQVVLPVLAPAVTGREPTAGIIDTLRKQGLGMVADPLVAADLALAEIDSKPVNPPESYKAIEHALAGSLPTKVEASRLFQVDMFKPAAELAVGKSVIEDLRKATELLHSLCPPATDAPWEQFKTRFTARYETREMPLLEVLDEESGIAFGEIGESPRAAPLLADLALPVRLEARTTRLAPRDIYLLSMVARALQEGATEVVLTNEDIEHLREANPMPLADVVPVQCQIAARSHEALAAGDYQIRFLGAARGAGVLGRFCHGSPDVASVTAECLRHEESLRPDTIFAEVVHLPEGRHGNVLLRPVLRDYEIPYLGTSGADPDKQIDVNDLLVSVVDGRVVLRSKRLGKEVMPRLTSAHNYSGRSLIVYRFLSSLATQGIGGAYWVWGLADEMPFVPRVRYGRIVLERARWTLQRADLAPLEAAFAGSSSAKTPDQIRAIRGKVMAAMTKLRNKLKLPRWIVVGDHDNELPVDLDNELMVESAAHLLKSRHTARVFELFPGPDQMCLHNTEGSFSHELIALLAQDRPPVSAPTVTPDLGKARRFLPASEWLYVKLYTGRATADALLRDHVAPAVRDVLEKGLASHWFFLRFGDPEWHVRLRFAGDPKRLSSEVLPYLHSVLAPAADAGLLWKIAVDTYEREVERYGGPHAIELAERLFHADSECCLSIVEALEGDAGTQATWRITLRGIDRLMDDLGLSLPEKLAAMTFARDGFGAEIGMDTAFQKRLGEKYRTHAAEIASLLDTPADDPDHMFGPAFEMIAKRSEAQVPLANELRALEAAGKLGQPMISLVHSFVHMHVNRMIRTSARIHEVVLYDFLRRRYEGQVARARKGAV